MAAMFFMNIAAICRFDASRSGVSSRASGIPAPNITGLTFSTIRSISPARAEASCPPPHNQTTTDVVAAAK